MVVGDFPLHAVHGADGHGALLEHHREEHSAVYGLADRPLHPVRILHRRRAVYPQLRLVHAEVRRRRRRERAAAHRGVRAPPLGWRADHRSHQHILHRRNLVSGWMEDPSGDPRARYRLGWWEFTRIGGQGGGRRAWRRVRPRYAWVIRVVLELHAVAAVVAVYIAVVLATVVSMSPSARAAIGQRKERWMNEPNGKPHTRLALIGRFSRRVGVGVGVNVVLIRYAHRREKCKRYVCGAKK
mmetsp:Transcript_8254/g.23751  ORF Transcript_8254/g.23751 Transcript_8254/m.23751 type:complete len:241 (+) Transcript_8254:1075-1797(+)